MRKFFTALFLCMTILCGIVETASGAISPCGQKSASGDFWENPNICTYKLGSLELEPCRRDTIVGYDSATGVLYYVRQNPWSSFDPLGLNADEVVNTVSKETLRESYKEYDKSKRFFGNKSRLFQMDHEGGTINENFDLSSFGEFGEHTPHTDVFSMVSDSGKKTYFRTRTQVLTNRETGNSETVRTGFGIYGSEGQAIRDSMALDAQRDVTPMVNTVLKAWGISQLARGATAPPAGNIGAYSTPQQTVINTTTRTQPRNFRGRQLPREYTTNNIKRLKKRMARHGYDRKYPVQIAIVNGRKIIIDGHHRVRSAGHVMKGTNKTVPYETKAVSPTTAKRLLNEAEGAADFNGTPF